MLSTLIKACFISTNHYDHRIKDPSQLDVRPVIKAIKN